MRVLPLVLLVLPGLALAGVSVSKFQTDNRDKGKFAAGNLVDGKASTVWAVPGESENKGEWVLLDVPVATVDKLVLFPGHGKDEETFKKYPRVKKVRVDVEVNGDAGPKVLGTATLDVADEFRLQAVDMPDIKVDDDFGGKVRVTILEIYEGADFPNLTMGELGIMLTEFDAFVGASGATVESPGHDAGLLVDKPQPDKSGKVAAVELKSFWSAPVTAEAQPEITLTQGSYSISSLGFVSPNKDFARPKTVEVAINGAVSRITLPDAVGAPQWAAVPMQNGYNGGAFGDITVKVVDTYAGTKSQEVAICDIKAKATSLGSI